MTGGFPVFLILLIIWLFSAASKGAKKKTGGAVPGSGKPGTGARTPAARPANTLENAKPAKGYNPYGSLPEETSSEGRSQLPAGTGYGSLPAVQTEGVDPCHDNPYAIPSGSLSADSMEGRDPCHEDWNPASPAALTVRPKTAAAPEHPAGTSGGLNLSWTGNDIVRGFVYGEILKRKAG